MPTVVGRRRARSRPRARAAARASDRGRCRGSSRTTRRAGPRTIATYFASSAPAISAMRSRCARDRAPVVGHRGERPSTSRLRASCSGSSRSRCARRARACRRARAAASRTAAASVHASWKAAMPSRAQQARPRRVELAPLGALVIGDARVDADQHAVGGAAARDEPERDARAERVADDDSRSRRARRDRVEVRPPRCRAPGRRHGRAGRPRAAHRRAATPSIDLVPCGGVAGEAVKERAPHR